MNTDATLQEIRDARTQVWQDCGEDWKTLLSYYSSLEHEEGTVVVQKPTHPDDYSFSRLLMA